MAVEKRVINGKVRWRARWRDDQGRQRSKTFDRKSDAERHHDSIMVSLTAGDYIDPRAGRVTLSEFFEEWSSRQVWNPRTEKAMRLAIKGFTYNNVPLQQVRRSHVESWVKEVTGRLAPGTIRTRLGNVRQVFRAAVRDRVIRLDPTEGVNLPRQPSRSQSMRLPTPQEVRAILEAASDEFMPFIAVGAFAGLRLGEVAGLQVRDISFLKRTITVRRQIQRRPGGGVIVDPPKSSSSERTVPVPEALIEILSRHVESLGDASPERFLFLTRGGVPQDQNVAGVNFQRACARAGVSGVTFHSLRHGFASALISGGADPVTVQHALGHARASTTLDTYTHLWPDAADRTRRISTSFAAEVLGGTSNAAVGLAESD